MAETSFRAALEQRGLTQSAFARLLHDNGDRRSVPTILRSVADYARNARRTPGEVWVIIRLLDKLSGAPPSRQ